MKSEKSKGDNGAWMMGRVSMLSSLFIAHIWGTALVWAAAFGDKDSSIISDMFASIGFMIFTTLGILVGGKGWKDFASMKYTAHKTDKEE